MINSKVAISTVTTGSMSAATAAWRERALLQLYPRVALHWEVSPTTLQAARCAQVDRFLASDCTHLFLLDSDVIPQENTIQKLLAYDLPFVAAPHASIKGDEIGVMVLDRNPNGEDNYVQHHPWAVGSGLQGPNVIVGCAGMLIRLDVFDLIEPPWFKCIYDKKTGRLLRTEDFDFCERVHKAGIDIWADCDLVIYHQVSMVI